MKNIFLSAIIATAFTQYGLSYSINSLFTFAILLTLVVLKLGPFAPSIAFGVALLLVVEPILVSAIRELSIQLTPLASIILCYTMSLFIITSINYLNLSTKKIIASIVATSIISIVFIKYAQFDNYTQILLCTFSSFSILYMANPFTNNFIKRRNGVDTGFVVFFIVLSLYPFQQFDSTKSIALVESQWCITTGDYSDDYTMKSAYSYSEMKNILSNKYTLHWVEKYNDLNLVINDIEVLIMLTPTQPFSDQQIENIRSFVNGGGRLIAIADHTDLYGHAAVLNEVLSPYGLKINFDSIFSKSKPMVNSQFDRFGNLDNVPLKTPCSVSMFRLGHTWAITPYSVSERGDYSKPNFFGDIEWTADDGISNWPIGVTVPYGKGEVSVFCDSTIFANFALFQPNNLEILEGLISGGHMSSRGSFWGFWLGIGTCVLMFIFPHYHYLKVPVACLIVFLLIGIKHNNSNTESFYPPGKTIDVYGEPKYIVEPPPNATPSSDTISSLYAHIARSGLYPRYIGEDLPKELHINTLLVTRADKATDIVPPKNADLLKVLIVDEIPQGSFEQFSVFEYGGEAPQELINFFPIFVTKRTAYRAERHHSIYLNGIRYLSAFGALNDRVLGNWWINTDISPYRRAILNDFYGWLRGENEVRVFQYPEKSKISSEGNGTRWKFTTDKGKSTDFFAHMQINQKFIYFGGGIWGLHSFYEGKEYLLGGPELIDDSYSILNLRWAAVSKEQ